MAACPGAMDFGPSLSYLYRAPDAPYLHPIWVSSQIGIRERNLTRNYSK
jgi:hypothetical protein